MEDRWFKWVWIPRDIRLRDDISSLAKMVLIEIDSLDKWEGCFASNDYFSEFFSVNDRQIKRALKELRDLDLIETVAFNWRKRILKAKIRPGSQDKNVPADRTKTSPIYNSIDNSIDIKKEKINKKEKKEYWEFKHIKLTDEEYEKIRKLVWWWINRLIEECDTWLELHPKKKYTNFYAFLKNRVQKNQKWKQNELEIKQKLYNANKSKYKNTFNNKNADIESAKQRNQEKIQQIKEQLLSNNCNNDEGNQDWAINRRREIWGNWIFQELE